mgnify:CR=1 FL=1
MNLEPVKKIVSPETIKELEKKVSTDISKSVSESCEMSSDASRAAKNYVLPKIKKQNISELLKGFDECVSGITKEQALELCTDSKGTFNAEALNLLYKLRNSRFADYTIEKCKNNQGEFTKAGLEYASALFENGCHDAVAIGSVLDIAKTNDKFDKNILEKAIVLVKNGVTQGNYITNTIRDMRYAGTKYEERYFDMMSRLNSVIRADRNPKLQTALCSESEKCAKQPELLNHYLTLHNEQIDCDCVHSIMSVSLDEETLEFLPEVFNKAIELHKKGMKDSNIREYLSEWKFYTTELSEGEEKGKILSDKLSFLEDSAFFSKFSPDTMRELLNIKAFDEVYEFNNDLLKSLNSLDENIVKKLKQSGIDTTKIKEELLEQFSVEENIGPWKLSAAEVIKEFGLAKDITTEKEIADIIKTIDFSSINLYDKYVLHDALSVIDSAKVKNLKMKYGIDIEEILKNIDNDLNGRVKVATPAKSAQQSMWQNIMANNNPETEQILKSFDFSQYSKTGLPLKYTRQELMADIDKKIGHLSEEEQNKILEQFGITKNKGDFDGILNCEFNDGYGVRDLIERFTLHNETTIANPKEKAVIDSLIQGFPGFTSIVGKVQHGEHASTVDIHTLKVLQTAMNDPIYQTLSNRDKTVFKFTTLLHDIGKKGFVVDMGHEITGAKYAMGVLEEVKLPKRLKRRVINNIKNHEWFRDYSEGKLTADDVAVMCRYPGDLRVNELLAKSDFAGVNPQFHLLRTGTKTELEYNQYMADKFKLIEERYKIMRAKTSIMFDSQFHDCSKFPVKTRIIDGKEYSVPVLDLYDSKVAYSLEQYGFARGVNKDNVIFSVHMVGSEPAFETAYRLFNNPVSETAISESIIRFNRDYTYDENWIGFIMDNEHVSISHYSPYNADTGFLKNYNEQKQGLFVGSNNVGNYTPDEQFEIMESLADKQYPTQVKSRKIGDKTISREEQLKFDKADLMLSSGEQNERVVLSPSMKAVAIKGKRYEDIPDRYFIKCANRGLGIVCI